MVLSASDWLIMDETLPRFSSPSLWWNSITGQGYVLPQSTHGLISFTFLTKTRRAALRATLKARALAFIFTELRR